MISNLQLKKTINNVLLHKNIFLEKFVVLSDTSAVLKNKSSGFIKISKLQMKSNWGHFFKQPVFFKFPLYLKILCTFINLNTFNLKLKQISAFSIIKAYNFIFLTVNFFVKHASFLVILSQLKMKFTSFYTIM